MIAKELVACAVWELRRRLKPTLLNGNGENEVAMVAKHWCTCGVGLGAQAGLPVLLKGKGAGEH